MTETRTRTRGRWLADRGTRVHRTIAFALVVSACGEEPAPRRAPEPAAESSSISTARLAVGAEHTCLVRDDHSLVCWGRNGDNQLGDGSGEDAGRPVRVVGLDGVVGVAAGRSQTCAWTEQGAAYCWGSRGSDDPSTSVTRPRRVPGVERVAEIAMSESSTRACARSTNGAVSCWTHATYSEPSAENAPRSLPDSEGAVALAVGPTHVCTLTAGHRMDCWVDLAAPPTSVELGGPARAIAVREHDTCAIVGDEVKCWSSPSTDPPEDRVPPRAITTLARTPNASMIALATTMSSAQSSVRCVLHDGAVSCWGSGSRGQLGTGDETDAEAPRPVRGVSDAIAVGVGDSHACALRTNGEVLCWGAADQCGHGRPSVEPSPVDVEGVTDAVELAANEEMTCARTRTGSVSCWGGQRTERAPRVSRPTAVEGIDGAVDLAVGPSSACARREGGRVSCWGRNVVAPGPGSSSWSGSGAAVEIEALNGVSSLEITSWFLCGRRANGLTCTGASPPSAARVAELSAARAIALGALHGCVVVGDRITCGAPAGRPPAARGRHGA